MITDLQYVANKGILIQYKENGEESSILFSDVVKYWEYANEEEFESGFANIINDRQILFSIIVAGGQGGALFIWDTDIHKIIHVSNADFCVAANVYNDKLFYLCEINYYGMPIYYKVFNLPVGTIDITNSGQEIFCQEPRKSYLVKNPKKWI